MHFPAWWAHYLHGVSAAGLERPSLSVLFLELSRYYVVAVRLHVYAADVLVRLGVDRDDFIPADLRCRGLIDAPQLDGTELVVLASVRCWDRVLAECLSPG
jgi:hypothetical protein